MRLNKSVCVGSFSGGGGELTTMIRVILLLLMVHLKKNAYDSKVCISVFEAGKAMLKANPLLLIGQSTLTNRIVLDVPLRYIDLSVYVKYGIITVLFTARKDNENSVHTI